jgi:hypothetical protein
MLTMQLAAVVLVATSLAASGCGGSSKTTSTTSTGATGAAEQTTTATTTATQTQQANAGPALTRAELIAKADVICARVNAVRASNVITSGQSLAQAVSKLSSSEQQALEEMSKLTPPAALESTWNLMLTGYKTMAANVQKIKQDISEGNSRQDTPLLVSGTKTLRQITADAKSAGFKDCGQTS